MARKELVILATQLDLITRRWSIASIDAAGAVAPLLQSAANDLANYATGSLDERMSFLRHRIAGALQQGADRLWGRTQKAELFAIEFTPADTSEDATIISRVSEHFCVWMVRPPVVCLQAADDGPPSVVASNDQSADLDRISSGLSAMRPLTHQTDLWEPVPTPPAA